MTVRGFLLVLSFFFIIPAGLLAQNLFPEKVDIANNLKYCMDCGTPKATVDSFTLASISDKMNYRYNFKGGSGSIAFQVIVDTVGFSCVISHSDASTSALTSELIVALNTCIWHPARVNGKRVNASVNVIFTIGNGKISGQMQRMDLTDITPAGNPTVFNQQYKYTNPSLKKYDFTVFNRYNSPIPDNVSLACIVDSSDVLWYATARGLSIFNGKGFVAINETNSPFTATTAIHTIAADKDNVKWMYANKSVFTNNDKGWQVYDSAHLSIARPYKIVTTSTGEVFFPTVKGLMIVRNNKIRLIDKTVVWQLPSNNVYYAYFDSRKRLWISTSRGVIMIGKDEKVTAFNGSGTPLNNAGITTITEDAQGNMYFAVNSLKETGADKEEEGLAVMTADGKWTHYNDKNSGLPANHINTLLYDKFDRLLWIGTSQAGLVKFDLKDSWEDYHNTNSAMPGYDVYQLAQDSKGVIYASTANGLVMITPKK